MDPIRHIEDFEHLKILADSRRLAILRLLMHAPATLSRLGQILGEHPARVRHHVKLLESAGLIKMVDQRVARGFIEKFYQAGARAYMLQQLILPSAVEGALTILGSHDLALELLTDQYAVDKHSPAPLFVVPVGSLEGLVGLRQGLAHLAGCHLFDAESGEYNLTYARHFFPDRSIRLITLAHREQGLLVAPGNPKGIHTLDDLPRADVTLINRNPGSGTRLWLDRSLRARGILPSDLHGYQHEVRTHTALAETIASGGADAGLGLHAAAVQHNLDFIQLFEERFDLITPSENLDSPLLRPLFDLIVSAQFRRQVDGLQGYSTAHTGRQIIP